MKHQKFLYKPGTYPTPMLGYQTNSDDQIFQSNDFVFGKFDQSPQFDHMWNISAYVIWDKENKAVIAYSFNDFIYLIWLLRIINQELEISINDEILEKNSETFNNIKSELVKKTS